MKAHIWKHILSAIQSLSDSTDVRYQQGRTVMKIRGRQSPYISHRHIEFDLAPPDERAHIVIENDRYALGIYPEDPKSIIEPGQPILYPVLEFIPAGILKPALEDAYPFIKPNFGELVQIVVWLPEVEKWDEDGRPVFKYALDAPPDALRMLQNGAIYRVWEGAEYVYFPADYNDVPVLEHIRDGEWHLVECNHRVGCTAGWGWYRVLE